ncbi:MAG: NADH-quinone oxidoreductase subunit J [Verrucomicrobia bacterium]|nr:NADH-quinone oxidoreductase subunit J [Verrucomicrobiota bacterium]
MGSLLFNVFALFTLIAAVGVVVNKNAVNAAMFLLLSLVGMAGLFVLLDAPLLAFVLLLVYAGAVVALFLFIIMLLDLKAENRRVVAPTALAGGVLVIFGFSGSLFKILQGFAPGKSLFPPLPTTVEDVKRVGMLLFQEYNLPLQIMATLLLVATVGVIVLSKRELR